MIEELRRKIEKLNEDNNYLREELDKLRST